MSDHIQPTQKQNTTQDQNPIPTKNYDSSTWTVLWLVLTLVAAFGVAGAYLEKRLESLEEKVVAQTGAISQQAYEQSKLTQKEILTNRAESAAIAQSMSNVMDEVSQMINESVQTFSTQTKQLATAVEAKEKSQAEFLKAKLEKLGVLTEEQSNGIQSAIEALAKEVVQTKTIVLESKQQSSEMDVQIAKLTKQLNDINANLKSGLVNLTDLVEQQNELIAAQFTKQSNELSIELTAIRESSAKSMNEVSHQIAALNETSTKSAETTAKQVHESIANSANDLSNSITGLQNRIADLSDSIALGQSTNEFNNEVIYSELTDVRNIMDVRTSDLLVENGETQTSLKNLQELAQSFETANQKVTESQIAQIETQFNGIQEELRSIETGLSNKLDAVSNRIEEAQLTQTDAKHQELLKNLKAITEDVGNFPANIADGLNKAKNTLNKLSENPESSETIKALDSILQELANSVQNTQQQVDSIKEQISSLTEKLTEITHAPIEDIMANDSSTSVNN